MLHIAPNISITCKAVAQIFMGLPNKKDGAIRGRIEKLPLHGLNIAHDFRCFGEISDHGLKSHVVRQRVSMSRDKMHVRQLFVSVDGAMYGNAGSEPVVAAHQPPDPSYAAFWSYGASYWAYKTDPAVEEYGKGRGCAATTSYRQVRFCREERY